MARALLAGMNMTGIAAMGGCQGAAQPVGIGRNQDEMHMIGHQAPSPNFDRSSPATGREAVAIEGIVLFAEERALASIATLGDMVRETGDDDTGETSHASP